MANAGTVSTQRTPNNRSTRSAHQRPMQRIRTPALNKILKEIRQQLLTERLENATIKSSAPAQPKPEPKPEVPSVHLWAIPINRLNRAYVQILSTPLLVPTLNRRLHRSLSGHSHLRRNLNRLQRPVHLINQITAPWMRWLEPESSAASDKLDKPLTNSMKNVSMSLSRGEWMLKVQAERDLQDDTPKNPAIGIDLGFVRLTAQINLHTLLPLNFLRISFKR